MIDTTSKEVYISILEAEIERLKGNLVVRENAYLKAEAEAYILRGEEHALKAHADALAAALLDLADDYVVPVGETWVQNFQRLAAAEAALTAYKDQS